MGGSCSGDSWYVAICGMKFIGQVDSPESPERPEITEMTENFTKFTKYLNKLKDTFINYV